jgi:hypothetical protein
VKTAVKVRSVTLILCFFVPCGSNTSSWKGTIEEPRGITVINNPKESIHNDPAVDFEEDLSIGVAQEEEEYSFTLITDIDVDLEGNIYEEREQLKQRYAEPIKSV